MKKLIFGASALLASQFAFASQTHWEYDGETGPQHWGTLHKDFEICGKGKNQSPINLTGFTQAQLTPLDIKYQSGGYEVINNGHTVQVNYAPGSELVLEGKSYELKQYHFHSPSENQIESKSYPMEMHLVHKAKDGALAVIAVMFEEGKENKALAQAWDKMAKKAGEKNALDKPVAAEGLLPSTREYYQFNGSLTTPPCSEGVHWFVMKNPVSASKAQLETFKQVMHHDNNRPVQAINARSVLQ